MSVKHPGLCLLTNAVLLLTALYSGISCLMTLRHASLQPQLLSETKRYRFLGYYMIAGINGILCLLTMPLLIALFRKNKRN